MHFDSPHLLLLLLAVPVVVVISWRQARRRAAVRFSSVGVMDGLPRSWRQRFMWIIPVLRAGALAALIVALARPQAGIGEVRRTAEGVAMMIVVDRSWSMTERIDFDGQEMMRIDVVKRLLKEFVLGNGRDLPGRRDDLLGLITFARFPETVCPLITDPEMLVKLVDSIELAPTHSETERGTAIGDAISLAAARLQRAESDLARRSGSDAIPEFTITSKVILLMTDGDENVGEVRSPQAARLCADWGIKVYAIGIGGGQPNMIRTPFGLQRVGETYPFDERALRRIAEVTNGIYRAAMDADSLRRVYAEVDKLDKTRIISTEYTNYEERFKPYALAALAALTLEVLLATTVLRRVP